MICPKCGRDLPADAHDPHICVECAKAENSRYSYLRTHQDNWLEVAKQASIDPWLQQPGETQWEYTVWCAYRDSYPGKRPSYSEVAKQLNTTKNVVGKVAQRWSFQTRMQLWMTACDKMTMQQRQKEIIEMNAAHIDMAQKLRDKLSKAIDLIDPVEIGPKQLPALLKLTAELERTARIDDVAQQETYAEMLHGTENPDLKKDTTQKSDLAEVVSILQKAGALGTITQVGVRETTTTKEVVAVEGKTV